MTKAVSLQPAPEALSAADARDKRDHVAIPVSRHADAAEVLEQMYAYYEAA